MAQCSWIWCSSSQVRYAAAGSCCCALQARQSNACIIAVRGDYSDMLQMRGAAHSTWLILPLGSEHQPGFGFNLLMVGLLVLVLSQASHCWQMRGWLSSRCPQMTCWPRRSRSTMQQSRQDQSTCLLATLLLSSSNYAACLKSCDARCQEALCSWLAVTSLLTVKWCTWLSLHVRLISWVACAHMPAVASSTPAECNLQWASACLCI